MERSLENGGAFWSRADGDIHAPHGWSTIDVLHVLGELGATRQLYPELDRYAAFVFNYQAEDGHFRYGKKSTKLPCMTARILGGLARIGMATDPKVEKSFDWLLATQWGDGGWRCPTVRLGKSKVTDSSNPGTTLYVLDAFRFRKNNEDETAALNHAVRFLLQHWEVRRPTGPCEFGIGSRFFQIEYPFLRYNLFYYVHVLSYYESARRDLRFQQALAQLESKVRDGVICLENPHKAWRGYAFAKKGIPSSIANDRLHEIWNNMGTG